MTTTTRFQTTVRLLLSTIAFAGVVLVGLAAARAVDGAGLRNCTELGEGFARAGCWEDVWSNGDEYRMTFATGCCSAFTGKAPDDLDGFYVMAPQDATPQRLNAAFRHDHVVRDIPVQNQGSYSVRLHGYFVICSPSGMTSGDCDFEMSSPGPGLTLPFAKTVNGQSLTSVEAVESGVEAGLVMLIDTGAAVVGTISPTR